MQEKPIICGSLLSVRGNTGLKDKIKTCPGLLTSKQLLT